VAQKQSTEARRTLTAQQIALDVRNTYSAVEMNRQRINAATKAKELAERQLVAEQKKFELGSGQIRFVLQEQQNVTAAQTSEIAALVNYTKALVDFDRAIGRTLRRNNIEIDKDLKIAVRDTNIMNANQ
jgi:outer membrane protein